MVRKNWLLVTIALLAAGSVSAQEPPKWTYAEGGFTNFDPGQGDSGSGGFAGGSFEILEMIHLIGEYNFAGDYSIWEVGGGWHGLLGDPLDIFGQITFTDVAFDSGLNEESDSGAKVAGGVRWTLGKQFEVKGTASWADLDAFDVSFEAEGLWFLMQNRLGLGASFELGDADQVRLFARWNFGK